MDVIRLLTCRRGAGPPGRRDPKPVSIGMTEFPPAKGEIRDNDPGFMIVAGGWPCPLCAGKPLVILGLGVDRASVVFIIPPGSVVWPDPGPAPVSITESNTLKTSIVPPAFAPVFTRSAFDSGLTKGPEATNLPDW